MDTSLNTRRVSKEQLDILWKFLNANRDLAVAHNRSLEAKDYSQRKWRVCAKLLNSSTYGARKDWRGWSKYWVDLKAKIKGKVKASNGSNDGEQALTEIQNKFLGLLGESFGEGISVAELDPFAEIEETTPQDGDSSESESATDIPELEMNTFEQDVEVPAEQAQPQTPQHSRPRPRRRWRQPSAMYREPARRSLVKSSQTQVDAVNRNSMAMEKLAQQIAQFNNTAKRIERIIAAAFPMIVKKEDGT